MFASEGEELRMFEESVEACEDSAPDTKCTEWVTVIVEKGSEWSPDDGIEGVGCDLVDAGLINPECD